jgi:glutamate-1-semialdehyde 2,1-aminomutase
MIVESAAGALLKDVDGNEYIDYCSSWGALILGHSHPKVVKAVQEQLEKGITYGISCELEEKLARKITQHLPSIEQVRFVSSGTEATMSAIRLARGFTGRELLIKFVGNYHGHADHLLVKAGSGVALQCSFASSKGVPAHLIQATLCLPYNDLEALESAMKVYGNQLAAVIIEPIAGNMGVVPAHPLFLQRLREWTRQWGALLIFDEVISGFRVGLGGAQKLLGVTPDLTCLGKIIGGGFPCAAFGGKREIMAQLAPLGEVYQAGTLSGNPVAMKAGLQTLELLEEPSFYVKLAEKTQRLLKPIQEEIARRSLCACVQQVGSMFTLFMGALKVDQMTADLNLAQFKQLFQSLFHEGIYIPPSQYEAWFVSIAHSEAQLDDTSEKIVQFLGTLSPLSAPTPSLALREV